MGDPGKTQYCLRCEADARGQECLDDHTCGLPVSRVRTATPPAPPLPGEAALGRAIENVRNPSYDLSANDRELLGDLLEARSHLTALTAERDGLRAERDRLADALDNPWSKGAEFPGYTVCDQCGCFHHITRSHDCKPEEQPPETAAALPGVVRRHYRPMPGMDQPSGPVVIVHFGDIWAWASTEQEAYQRFEKKLADRDASIRAERSSLCLERDALAAEKRVRQEDFCDMERRYLDQVVETRRARLDALRWVYEIEHGGSPNKLWAGIAAEIARLESLLAHMAPPAEKVNEQ